MPERATDRTARGRRTYVRQRPSALDAIVRASADGLGLPALLSELGSILLSSTSADRASFFLLRPDLTGLDLWSVTGREDARLWDLGLSMPAISLDDVPDRRDLLDAGDPVAIADAARSSIVPPRWVELFQLGAVLIGPLRAGGQSLGIVAVDYRHPRAFDAVDVERMRALAQGCSAAIGGTILGRHLAEVAVGEARRLWVVEHAAREQAVAAERERVVADVQTTLADLLRAIRRLAAELGPDASGLGVLAGVGLDELQQLTRTLPALSYNALGFEPTMRGLVERLGTQLGANATFEVRGHERPLEVAVEQSLLRVAHEALGRIARRGKATGVVVLLEFVDDGVELVVRDDGIDLSTREEVHDLGPHHGLRLLRRRLEALGGTVSVERKRPRGIQVTAKVPA